MILIDFSNICISSILAQRDKIDVHNIDMTRHIVLNSIRSIRKKFFSEYGECIICVDGPNSWRKEYFPYYKASRKKSRDDSNMNWNAIYQNMTTIVAELIEHFPYKTLKLDRVEADDILAVLAKELPGKHVIISVDKDMIQLMKYPNVSVYNPLNDEFRNITNPEFYLFEHVIRGDVGDGIPNILSDGDTFIMPDKRQKTITSKKIEYWWINQEEIPQENIDRNRKIIDFDQIPQEISQQIIDKYNETQTNDRRGLLDFFIKKKLKILFDRIGEF